MRTRENAQLRRKWNSETGASVIEFALIFPILLVLTFAIIELGFFLYNKAMITNAAREGARAGIIFSQPPRVAEATIRNVVNQYCTTHLITFAGTNPPVTTTIKVLPTIDGAEIVYDPNTFVTGQYMKVTTTYLYTFLIFDNVIELLDALNLINVPASVPITAFSQMRSE